MERELDKILNIAPPTTAKEVKDLVTKVEENLALALPVSNGLDERFEEEFEITRTNLREIIDQTKKSVYRLSMIANDTEKAIDFGALSQMTTVLLAANKQILEIYEFKKKYLKEEKKVVAAAPTTQVAQGGVNIQNAVFTGSREDFKKFIAELEQEDVIDQ